MSHLRNFILSCHFETLVGPFSSFIASYIPTLAPAVLVETIFGLHSTFLKVHEAF